MIAPLDEEHVDIILKTLNVGRLACSADDQPYIVPVTYVYEDGYIYGHTNDGRKVRTLRQNPKVCFEVDQVHDMANWQSVVAFGTYEELDGAEAAKALDLIVARLSPYKVSESVAKESSIDRVAHDIRLKPTKGVTYRIKVSEKSGRYERH